MLRKNHVPFFRSYRDGNRCAKVSFIFVRSLVMKIVAQKSCRWMIRAVNWTRSSSPGIDMFVCQRQFPLQKRSSLERFAASRRASRSPPSLFGTGATDLSATAERSSATLSGCLGNVIGGHKCLERDRRSPAQSCSSTTACISESRSGGGFRRRQRRRRRPVYLSSSGNITSASPDCRSSQGDSRRRRPVQPWHLQQQNRVVEVQNQLANLSTVSSPYGTSQQHPVTLVDSSWWPVPQQSSVCIRLCIRDCRWSAYSCFMPPFCSKWLLLIEVSFFFRKLLTWAKCGLKWGKKMLGKGFCTRKTFSFVLQNKFL